MISNGEVHRVGAGVLVCLGLAALSACTSTQSGGSASWVPTASSVASASASAPRTVSGTAFYLESTTSALVVHAVHGGADTTASIAADDGPCPGNTAVISPDGRQIAWVATVDPNGEGDLMVSDLTGAHRRKLRSQLSCLGNTSLTWLVQSQIAATSTSDENHPVLLDPATGKPLGNEDKPDGWSADGAWEATRDGSGKPVVRSKGNLAGARRYSYTPPAAEAEHYDGWSARSVSIDGRYVSVGWIGTDPSRNLGSFAVVDTVTSTVVPLPVTGAAVNIDFLADGTVLVRTAGGQLVLLDRQFSVLAQVTEPASVHELALLTYLPSAH